MKWLFPKHRSFYLLRFRFEGNHKIVPRFYRSCYTLLATIISATIIISQRICNVCTFRLVPKCVSPLVKINDHFVIFWRSRSRDRHAFDLALSVDRAFPSTLSTVIFPRRSLAMTADGSFLVRWRRDLDQFTLLPRPLSLFQRPRSIVFSGARTLVDVFLSRGISRLFTVVACSLVASTVATKSIFLPHLLSHNNRLDSIVLDFASFSSTFVRSQ